MPAMSETLNFQLGGGRERDGGGADYSGNRSRRTQDAGVTAAYHRAGMCFVTCLYVCDTHTHKYVFSHMAVHVCTHMHTDVCVATHTVVLSCSVLQCAAVCSSFMVCCSVLQCVVVCCSVLCCMWKYILAQHI